MSFDLKVDHYTQAKEGGETTIVRTNPYLRLKAEGIETPFFLRAGKVFTEDGVEVQQPEWPAEEMLKSNEQALNAVGFTKEGGRVTSIPRNKPKGKE